MPSIYEKIRFQNLVFFTIHLMLVEPNDKDIEEIDERLFEIFKELVFVEFDEFLQNNDLTNFNSFKELVDAFELFAKLKYQSFIQ
ncbi:hypothetical protein NGA84_05600 [Lactococcus formosensis]|uniref:Uncharacterized protein n=1 Tax=Lactococcus formosensis TaxID=1281486 RepID=A0A9X4PJF4_9LACT|nr:hypothetical protein [Lactococcus formosensis]MDG6142821.1 hypothetical protein [Lactococcus formosensis]MDG6159752.1 hypothetical protein [Lactococcus formosensis]MDG6166296.1 hypothetical protein [Lactococcus formosensis]MDG6172420.1 hypothetical protein [Lactococcus formosensis]MDG6193184.1 hypothetical protein [Lactococcus formosensis]